MMVPYVVFFGPTGKQDPYIISLWHSSFYVTYKTNKFRTSFAPFTGINHHLHSIFFEGTLLEDGTTEMFVWFT